MVSLIDKAMERYAKVDKLNKCKQICIIAINNAQLVIYDMAKVLACDFPELSEKLLEIYNKFGECADEVNKVLSEASRKVRMGGYENEDNKRGSMVRNT